MLVILFLSHVYYTSHLDKASDPLVALCGMIVTLLDSSASRFFLSLMGYLFLFLPHGLTIEYIISIFIFYCCKHVSLSVNNKMIVNFLLIMEIT